MYSNMQIISLNMQYARYKNVPSRNEFYGKNYPRINWQTFGSDDYHVVLSFADNSRGSIAFIHVCLCVCL